MKTGAQLNLKPNTVSMVLKTSRNVQIPINHNEKNEFQRMVESNIIE